MIKAYVYSTSFSAHRNSLPNLGPWLLEISCLSCKVITFEYISIHMPRYWIELRASRWGRYVESEDIETIRRMVLGIWDIDLWVMTPKWEEGIRGDRRL